MKNVKGILVNFRDFFLCKYYIISIISILWEDNFLEKDYVSNLKNIISRLRNKIPALKVENLYGMGYKIKRVI